MFEKAAASPVTTCLATISRYAGVLKVVAGGRMNVAHIAVLRKRLLERFLIDCIAWGSMFEKPPRLRLPRALATISKHAGALKVVANGRISVAHIAVLRKSLLEQLRRCARPANLQPARISNSRVVRHVHLLQQSHFRQNSDLQCDILQT